MNKWIKIIILYIFLCILFDFLMGALSVYTGMSEYELGLYTGEKIRHLFKED